MAVNPYSVELLIKYFSYIYIFIRERFTAYGLERIFIMYFSCNCGLVGNLHTF